MSTLELRGLTRRFAPDARATVDAVDLTVHEAEVLVLVGPSGCGKSTILRLIAGLDQATAGTIALDGSPMDHVPPQQRDIAMVFQGYALYPHMSARDNLAFPLRMRRVSKADTDSRVAEAARLLAIDHLLDRYPGQLSGGERQRVAMGRALVRRPKVFLFDEPLSNLDAALRTELRAELGRLLRRLKATAIYVTHDQVEAMTIGQRVAVMKAGRIEQVGTAESIYRKPATLFVAGFLGMPPINRVRVTRDGDQGRCEALALPWPGGLAGNAATVAFRPECVSLREAETESTVSLVGEVTLVEPLGAESVIHVAAVGTQLRARTTGFSEHQPGDRISLHIARQDVVWFDDNEQRWEDGGA